MNEKQKMRKRNMKIFPTYKKIGWDYLFFYTIDFLFLNQVKGISASDIVLKSSFYALFGIILQIPANVIVEFLGRRNSIILGNILNCFYMIVILLSQNLGDLIFAEFISAIAFSIKNVAEPSLLNESIPPSRYKSNIYSKINSKGAAGYYRIGAVSKLLAGFLFSINPYIPIVLALVTLIFATLLSVFFIEPLPKKKKTNLDEVLGKKELKDIKEGFAYILKSERLKALILCSALIASLLSILSNYYVSLAEEVKMTAILIGVISAVGSYLGSIVAKNEKKIETKFKNRTLISMALLLSITAILAGILGMFNNLKAHWIIWIGITIMQLCYYTGNSLYYTIIDRYLRNFTNAKIDTKIFAVNHLFISIFRVIAGLCASFLLTKLSTRNSILIIGIIFTLLYILIGQYMKKRVGLKPEEYSKEEVKYDEHDFE